MRTTKYLVTITTKCEDKKTPPRKIALLAVEVVLVATRPETAIPTDERPAATPSSTHPQAFSFIWAFVYMTVVAMVACLTQMWYPIVIPAQEVLW